MKKVLLLLIFLGLLFINPNKVIADTICNLSNKLSGTVIDSTDNTPLSGVVITWYLDGAADPTTYTTNRDGTFQFNYRPGYEQLNLTKLKVVASFEKKGYTRVPNYQFTQCANSVKMTKIFAPPPAGSNPKCAKNRDDGKPVACLDLTDCNDATDECRVCTSGVCSVGSGYVEKPGTAGCDQCTWCDLNNDGLLDDKDPKPFNWQKCFDCVNPKSTLHPQGIYKNGGSWTALGCIDTTPDGFVSWFLTGAIGIGGGVAFLIMLWGVFTMITSAGNPERLNQGREIIVSAIAGLIMIIFSVFLLRVIGVDILKIPGFS